MNGARDRSAADEAQRHRHQRIEVGEERRGEECRRHRLHESLDGVQRVVEDRHLVGEDFEDEGAPEDHQRGRGLHPREGRPQVHIAVAREEAGGEEWQEGAQPHARGEREAHRELRGEEGCVRGAHAGCSDVWCRCARRSSIVAMVRFRRFHAMPFTKAAWYEPVRSKIFPDIQPPSAMPSMGHMMKAPTRAPPSDAGKCSRTMMAYEGTRPPWKSPKSAAIT